MISHSHKCIFVHIPKVAGTSIIEVLKDPKTTVQENRIKKPFVVDDDKFDPPPPHFRALDYVKYGQIKPELFDQYFKFSFVRNPWARMVSEYRYRDHARKYSFKEFLFHHLPTPAWTDEYCHIIPQYDFLYDAQGQCLVDFIGKLENLREDFAIVCDKLGLSHLTLPHSNQSQSLFHLRNDAGMCEVLKRIRGILSRRQKQNTFADYKQYYDLESREYVAELYEQDIKTFDYQFER